MRLRSSATSCRGHPRTCAATSRVKSSSVGPRPPVSIMREDRAKAARSTMARSSFESPTMVLNRTKIPQLLSLSVRKSELVSVCWGVRSSEPTAMISASIVSYQLSVISYQLFHQRLSLDADGDFDQRTMGGENHRSVAA